MQSYMDANGARARQAAVNGLAIVGFVALVFLGILLAIYAARAVPVAVTRLVGGAFLAGGAETTLTSVPTTSLPFPGTAATTSEAIAASTSPAKISGAGATTTTVLQHPTSSAARTASGIVGYRTITSDTYTPGSIAIPSNPAYTGLSNLVVSITAVGYTDSNGNFVQTNSLSRNKHLTVKILVTNSGTNKTGNWTIHTVIPTSSSAYRSLKQDEPSLEPKGVLPLTLTLTKGTLRTGDNQEITAQVDSDNDVAESNESDNTASVKIDVD